MENHGKSWNIPYISLYEWRFIAGNIPEPAMFFGFVGGLSSKSFRVGSDFFANIQPFHQGQKVNGVQFRILHVIFHGYNMV
jgi:hypothetical protein